MKISCVFFQNLKTCPKNTHGQLVSKKKVPSKWDELEMMSITTFFCRRIVVDWSIHRYSSLDVYEKTTWYSIDCDEEGWSSNSSVCEWQKKCTEINATSKRIMYWWNIRLDVDEIF